MESSRPQTIRNAAVLAEFFDHEKIQSLLDIEFTAVQHFLVYQHSRGLSPKTLKNHWGSLSQFCNYCVRRGFLLDNPCKNVRLPKIKETIPIYLTREDVREALKIARQYDRYCEVALAIHTGLRRGELRRLQWIDIDLTPGRSQLLVRESKSKRPRAVPLNQVARDALAEQKEKYGHLVYVFPRGKPRGGWTIPAPRGWDWWNAALEPLQSALPAFQRLPKGSTGRAWHCLRHTFATLCVQADEPIDLYQVGEWLGHSSQKMTRRYAHLAPGYNAKIERIVF